MKHGGFLEKFVSMSRNSYNMKAFLMKGLRNPIN